MAKIFTAAMVQGMLRSFSRIFLQKYSQRVCGTGCLTLRPSLHLEVHYVIKIPMSEAAQSNFSLLPWLKVRYIVYRDFHTEIFAGGLWDKIFVTGTVAALGDALSDRDFNIRTSMVKFFTAAIAQGAPHFFAGYSD